MVNPITQVGDDGDEFFICEECGQEYDSSIVAQECCEDEDDDD